MKIYWTEEKNLFLTLDRSINLQVNGRNTSNRCNGLQMVKCVCIAKTSLKLIHICMYMDI